MLLKLAVNLRPVTCATCGCNFSCEYLNEFAKILNCAKGIAKGPENMNHEKNQIINLVTLSLRGKDKCDKGSK